MTPYETMQTDRETKLNRDPLVSGDGRDFSRPNAPSKCPDTCPLVLRSAHIYTRQME